MHHQRERTVSDKGDGSEILRDAERELEEMGRDRDRAVRRGTQCVAVHRGARDDLARNAAARAGAVVDHHLLAEQLRHLRRIDSRCDVGGAARRLGYEHADGLDRILLRERGARSKRQDQKLRHEGHEATK